MRVDVVKHPDPIAVSTVVGACKGAVVTAVALAILWAMNCIPMQMYYCEDLPEADADNCPLALASDFCSIAILGGVAGSLAGGLLGTICGVSNQVFKAIKGQ